VFFLPPTTATTPLGRKYRGYFWCCCFSRSFFRFCIVCSVEEQISESTIALTIYFLKQFVDFERFVVMLCGRLISWRPIFGAKILWGGTKGQKGVIFLTVGRTCCCYFCGNSKIRLSCCRSVQLICK